MMHFVVDHPLAGPMAWLTALYLLLMCARAAHGAG
jgi:hypothetical protein